MNNDPWYTNPRWRRLRACILRRDDYLDQEAKRFGLVREAEVVHHIFPRQEYPQYQYEPWNLISLSRMTHNEMHDRDSDELSEKGKDLLRRTCVRMGMPVPEKYTFQKKGGHKKRDKYYT